jgi:hypothetical protein
MMDDDDGDDDDDDTNDADDDCSGDDVGKRSHPDLNHGWFHFALFQ